MDSGTWSARGKISAKYRPEIDGLRAIALLATLAFHSKISTHDGFLVSGGFIGVDIFFVISGFLVTLSIIQEVDATGSLSLSRFYERRCRRILPALFLVVFLSLPFALSILGPADFVRYAYSLCSVIFLYSNYHYYNSLTSYDSESSLLDPFVHTWSLAIEEQFYILLPLGFLLMKNRRSVLIYSITAIIVLSFAGSIIISSVNSSLSFFGLPTRAWELLLGSVLACFSRISPHLLRRTYFDRILPSLGLFLVLSSIFCLDLMEWPHPAPAAVPAVLGVCLIIWFANDRDPVSKILSMQPFVAIGVISYSVYLWHYPIFVFSRHLNPSTSLLQIAVCIVISFAAATLSYRFIEQPFRRKEFISRRVLFGYLTISGSMITMIIAIVVLQGGLPERFPKHAMIYGKNEFDNEALRDESWSVLNNLAINEKIGRWNAQTPSNNETSSLWFDTTGEAIKILIVGDSHSKDIFNAFYLNRELYPNFEFARFGLSAQIYLNQIETLVRSPNFIAADRVLITFRYINVNVEALRQLFDMMKSHQKRIAIFTNTVEFEYIDDLPLFDWYIRSRRGVFVADEINEIAYGRRKNNVDLLNKEIAQLADSMQVPVLHKENFLCDDVSKRCIVVTPQGFKAFYDYGHFTLEGAAYFGRRMKDIGWMKMLL